MLVIRMQRVGRKGLAQFRVVVQDSRRTPTSGKVVAKLGSFNPHTKETQLDKEKAEFYLSHGAQPSDRVVRLLKSEGVKLPKWVEVSPEKQSKIRNPEKLRRNQPDEPAEEAPAEESAEAPTEEAASETPAEAPAEESSEEKPAETEAPEDSGDEKAPEADDAKEA